MERQNQEGRLVMIAITTSNSINVNVFLGFIMMLSFPLILNDFIPIPYQKEQIHFPTNGRRLQDTPPALHIPRK